jgi:hypothetical protein
MGIVRLAPFFDQALDSDQLNYGIHTNIHATILVLDHPISFYFTPLYNELSSSVARSL